MRLAFSLRPRQDCPPLCFDGDGQTSNATKGDVSVENLYVSASAPAPASIGDDEPLTLSEACETLFRGRIKPATLRAEARRGRLVIERIGRTDFVTASGIREMRRQCRGHRNAPASGLEQPDEAEPASSRPKRPGSFLTGDDISPRDALLTRLDARTRRSKVISPTNTSPGALRKARIQ